MTLASSSSEDAESETPSTSGDASDTRADEQPAEPDIAERDNDLRNFVPQLTLAVEYRKLVSTRHLYTLTNLYARAVDLNQLQLNFAASAPSLQSVSGEQCWGIRP